MYLDKPDLEVSHWKIRDGLQGLDEQDALHVKYSVSSSQGGELSMHVEVRV